ncbi:MAG: nucleotide exchange factor GrpE [Chitinophagaceae bacterium]
MEEKDMMNNEEQTTSAQEQEVNSVEPASELDLLKKELEEQKEKFIRLYADFDNFKRRNAKERVELIQTAGREVIQSLLEVLDDCDRAEKQMHKSDDVVQIKEGIQLVFAKLRNTMQSKGLKEMKTVGEEFNADFHEAITEIPVTDESMKGKVVDEVEKGYTLSDKIIRFAKVVVGK